MNKVNWNFNNTYFNLSSTFKEDIKPTPVKKPQLVLFNKDLSSELNLDFSKVNDKELSEIFSGNILPEGSNSIAQAYAGHQFGHFTMLGDGRAILIGEHITKLNEKFGNLDKNKLLKTGGYDKHSKHQEKSKSVDKNMTTKDSLNYGAQEGTMR